MIPSFKKTSKELQHIEDHHTKLWFFAEAGKRAEIVQGSDNCKMRHEGGWAMSRSGGSATREELIRKIGLLDKPCVECGKMIQTNYCEPIKSEMIALNVCFGCHFWLDILKSVGNPRRHIVGGNAYWREDDSKNGKGMLGFGGREWIIQPFEGEKIVTHNLWCQGEIPPHFRERIKDNATFPPSP